MERSGHRSEDEGPENWLDRHGDYLYRYALSRVRESALAEELVQETLLSAIDAEGSFDGRSSRRTWLAAILRHKVLDHHRQAARRLARETPLDPERIAPEGMFDAGGEWLEKPAPWPEPPEALYHRSEFMAILSRCMEGLGRRQASAFTLREMEGEESREICEALGISQNNLWVILYRARQLLRRCLERRWFGKDA